MKILIFLFMFLVVGGLFIIGNEKLSLQDLKFRERFLGLYLEWFGNVFENSKTITGQVIRLDWLPGNRT